MDVFDKDQLRTRRRETILKVAGQLFCSHGFNAVSVDQLAAELGIAKTVIYSHFAGGKAELFKACHVASTELLELAAQKAVSEEPLQRLEEFIHAYVPTLLGDKGPGAVLLDLDILPDNMGHEIRDRRDKVYRLIQDWLNEAALSLSGVEDHVAAAIFTRVIFGGINVLPKWYRDEESWTPEMIADSICRTIRGWASNPQ